MSDKTDAGKDVRENLDSIENDVLNGLMPFQRATVEHIDHLYREGHKRVLVADEVGLGKTMHSPETKDLVPASERRVRDLTRARLVVVDEIGCERLGQAEATLPFGSVSQCAEGTSLVVTSKRGGARR